MMWTFDCPTKKSKGESCEDPPMNTEFGLPSIRRGALHGVVFSATNMSKQPMPMDEGELPCAKLCKRPVTKYFLGKHCRLLMRLDRF